MCNQNQIHRRLLFSGVLLIFIFSALCAQQKVSGHSNLGKYLTEKKWNELFPNRNNLSVNGDLPKKKKKKDFYSFKAFMAAVDSFPQFLSSEDTVIQKRELCAFLANIAYETGGGWDEAPGGYYKWGLYYTQEKGCEKGCPQYADSTKLKYPPQANQSYHGRGPLQISWNYNYGQFSEVYLRDKEILLKNPGLITEDPVLCFASAIWFWTTAQYPKPSCHTIISGQWRPTLKDSIGGRLPGFGTVVNVINGGIECNNNTLVSAKYRYGYYQFFCKYFKVDPGANVECITQKPFGQ
jgi:basic endochitinase B